MSSIKAVEILDQIAGLMVELRKELATIGTSTSSMDTTATDFLVSQIRALSINTPSSPIPATVIAAPAVAAATASSPKTKTASKPKAKETSVANILTEAQLQEMLAAGVKAQAHTKKLAADWFGASKFNIPESQHQAARDQWVAFGKSNGAVRTTRGGHDTWPAPAPGSPTSVASVPAAAPASPSPAAPSSPVAAPAAAASSTPTPLLSKPRLNQLKSYGVHRDAELGEVLSWLNAWRIPATKHEQVMAEWRLWAATNGVAAKPRDDDGDTMVGDGEESEMDMNFE